MHSKRLAQLSLLSFLRFGYHVLMDKSSVLFSGGRTQWIPPHYTRKHTSSPLLFLL